ncbi:MAG: hypothetical protein CO035_03595 [Candidatus Omnitrophica bacterium CG_4_9_14_0_2_um_filter_42_8]|nr:MAG: hypothetical protein COW92_03715 [Candidatus Omnitrophica bacterium CG22_combo_CG10-13_8_21_14_all_43_16]PJC48418.1 MAG: hypothetical protein CO035_03595 [Candidatus Omnitrophica bacterium CG_4_9_14_0_2_um_filter_42_8]
MKYEGLLERINWLIRLRWIALTGVILTVFVVQKVVRLSLPFFPLYLIPILIGLYNSAFFLYTRHIWKKQPEDIETRAIVFANLQIGLDLLSLTALIHFSGGIENPFIFYFIFHMIIASILLSRRASFLQATFTACLFVSMAGLEYFNILGHHCLKGFVVNDLYMNKVYILGTSFVFITTLYLAAYMASSISVKLRLREKSLKEANLLLEEKDRIKSEYVLRVTHDIKEHISAIQSCIDPVAEGMLGELNPGQKDLIRRAGTRTSKLIFFIKALLEITRIKLSRDIEMKDFSIVKTAENAIILVDPRAKAKSIYMSRRIDAGVDIIKGAQVYIEETIANLLANSVKYTPKGGKVEITIEDKDGSVLIRISDNGIGIPKKELPYIFNEFYRASNAKELERDGTGLGLSMAKQVVERHNGRIWVDSEEGRGSTFSIMLPKK